MARVFTILFLLFLGFSVIYHRKLMDASTSEILLRAATGDDKFLVLQGKGFLINRFREGKLLSRFQGGHASLYANGQLILTDKLELTLPGTVGSPPLRGMTDQAYGSTEVFSHGDSFADSRRQLKMLHLPQNVWVQSGTETAKTSDIYLDLQNLVARSDKPVWINGTSGRIFGVGFTYGFSLGELEIRGPVEGLWFPKDKENSQ